MRRLIGRPAGPGSFATRFGPTFRDYLNSAVGPQFSPPISFAIETYDILDIGEAAKDARVDFAMLDPVLASCAVAESEGNLNAILTINREVHGESLCRPSASPLEKRWHSIAPL